LPPYSNGQPHSPVTTVLIDVPVHNESAERLAAIPVVAKFTDTPSEERRSLPASLLADVEILFCTRPPANFEEMKSLRLIQIASSGYSQLFGLDLAERGVRACNARGVFDTPIAEWNLAMMVALARDLRGMIRNQETHTWDRSATHQKELRGSTVGIWGYGGIGRETARLAKAFGLRVHVLARGPVRPEANVYAVKNTGDPNGELPDRVFTTGEELVFLQELDFLVLALPLTNETEGLLGERELQSLPRTAYLLNPARGPIVQEEALLRALREQWIAGAALDTHYHYPMPPEHPLWAFPNVIFTPHISGSSLSTHFTQRIWDVFLQNTRRYLNGEPLLNELTAAELSG
jgi:phosphoglycerate dehydrogenase-like enzyme